MSENYLAFKAVSFHDGGNIYSLGMGPAKVIPLPVGKWIKSKKGISAGRTLSNAKKVIYIAKQRKTLPIPPDMRVVSIVGRGIKFESSWRIIFNKIMIIPTGEQWRGIKEITSDRKVELIKDVLTTYREVERAYCCGGGELFERAKDALDDIGDIIGREY